MKKALIIQHVPHEGPGIIQDGLKKSGIDAEFVKIYKEKLSPDAIDGKCALIILGGPMGVYEEEIYPFMKTELKLIESALKKNIPVLGICLGAQLLAKAAGARVYKGQKKEIGWYKLDLNQSALSDRLFLGMPDEIMVFQWHGDTFDIPVGAKNLASSGLFPNQLLKVGHNAYGLQFHLEVTPEMIREWFRINFSELAAIKYIDPDKAIGDTNKYWHGLRMYGDAVFSRFLRAIGSL